METPVPGDPNLAKFTTKINYHGGPSILSYYFLKNSLVIGQEDILLCVSQSENVPNPSFLNQIFLILMSLGYNQSVPMDILKCVLYILVWYIYVFLCLH